jgi:hypothetical protein
MSADNKIKVGFCVAYDWEYLRISLPIVYPYADAICLAVDKDRISWAGQKFSFNSDAFYTYVKSIDTEKKIDIYEDDFHFAGLQPMQNEVRQRNKMAERMGAGGWHIQLDTDEYFVDFSGFVAYLRHLRISRPVNITCPWYTMYKQAKDGYLFIKETSQENIEYIPVATRHPHYEYGRRNSYFNIKTNYIILHQSWARSENEILEKISNWGHKEDFDVMSYYKRWQTLNNNNYSTFNDFHPIIKGKWNELEYIPGRNIPELLTTLKTKPPFHVDKRILRKQNSIWHSRFKALLSKLGIN